MIKVRPLIIKDILSPYHLEKFHVLLGKRVVLPKTPLKLNLGDHLLYFNPISNELDLDGYFSSQAPSALLADPRLAYKRRLWANGEMNMHCAMSFNQVYTCEENINFIKKIKDNYYVCIERKLFDNTRVNVAKELRTLVYTNTSATSTSNNTSVRMNTEGISIGTFTFTEMDIINYGKLSLNPHRIHWDREYCVDKEGYENIIVQGPFAVQVMLAFACSHFKKDFKKIKYKNTNHIYPNTEIQIWYDNATPTNVGMHRLWMKDTNSEKVFLKAELTC